MRRIFLLLSFSVCSSSLFSQGDIGVFDYLKCAMELDSLYGDFTFFNDFSNREIPEIKDVLNKFESKYKEAIKFTDVVFHGSTELEKWESCLKKLEHEIYLLESFQNDSMHLVRDRLLDSLDAFIAIEVEEEANKRGVNHVLDLRKLIYISDNVNPIELPNEAYDRIHYKVIPLRQEFLFELNKGKEKYLERFYDVHDTCPSFQSRY